MPLLLETSDPSLHFGIEASDLSSTLVKAFTLFERAHLDVVSKVKQRREGVRKLQDANGSDEAGQIGELRDGGGDDEGDGPVDWNNDDPQEFARTGAEGRELEELHEDVLVDDFDADVAVQGSSDQR